MSAYEICFECLGEVNPCDLSDLRRIQRLENEVEDYAGQSTANVDVAAGCFNHTSYHAFGYDVEEAAFLENIDSFFAMATQNIGRLERSIMEANKDFFVLQGENSEVFYEHRLQVATFLRSLLILAKRGTWRTADCSNNESTRDVILTKLVDFLLRVGQLATLPSHVCLNMASVQGNRCHSSLYHLAHLHLDVKYYCILILTEIDADLGSDFDVPCETNSWLFEQGLNLIEMGRPKPCDQYSNLVLWDLVSLAHASFCKVAIKDYFSASPFPCSCCRDLWVFMLQLLDNKTKEHKDSFWVTLHGIYQTILQDEPGISCSSTKNTSSDYLNVIPDFSDVNRLGFCWWLLLHISPIYQINDKNDPLLSAHQPVSNYFEIINLLKRTLSSDGNGCSENQMRCYLRCCLSICETWEASSEVPLLLWEHFFRRLNDLFMDAGEVTTNYHSGKSGLDWIRAIRSITDDQCENRAASLNSYQLFLRLVAVQLKKSARANSLVVWRQLKGRIFSKFHPRKIQELNMSGLHNCFCLFLTLASIADLDDVVGKVCDLLEMMAPSMTEHNKHCLIWKAMFALMLVCEERNRDMALPAKKMADELDNLARNIVEKPMDTLKSHMASELLTVYMEGLQDVFEHSSSLSLSEYILIAPSFSELLSKGMMSDLQLALTALQVILARHRMVNNLALTSCGETVGGTGCCVATNQHEALADALWCYVFPIIKEKALADTPLGMLADVASSLTLLVVDMPPKVPRPIRETLTSLMSYFCFSGNCGAEYLSHCLAQPHLVERMERAFPDCQAHVLRVWIRLALQLPNTHSQVQELTRFILKLPETANIFTEADHALPNVNTAIVSFFKALDVYHSKNQSLGLTIRQKIGMYFSDVALTMDSVLKRCRSDEVANLYAVVGQLVRHIATLVYVRSKPDCLLNRVIRTMLLPPTFVYSQDKVMPESHLNALRDTLPLYIEGLHRLGCRRDPFICRTVKEAFIHYLPRYSMVSTSSFATVHPLVVSLIAVMRLQTANLDLFTVAVEAICDNYLTKKEASFHLGVRFINDVLMRCTAIQRLDCRHFLIPLLIKSLMLLTDDFNSRRDILDLLKMLVAGSSSGQTAAIDDVSERFSLCSVLDVLIRQKFAVQTERLLKLLVFLSDSFPEDIVQMIPLLADELDALETKNGTGKDENLRLKYKQFLTTIEVIMCQRRAADK